jgi:anti-sigma B factor antagonist
MGSLRVDQKDPLDAQICASDRHALVTLSGDLDLATAPTLAAQLAELAEKEVRHVAMDLSALEFMDSSGLSLVMAEHQRVELLGGELIIFSPRPQVRRLFEATGLDGLFTVRPLSVHPEQLTPGARLVPPWSNGVGPEPVAIVTNN